MKSGFTIIELIVAVLIASLMAMSLFQLLTQTRRSVRRMSAVMEVDPQIIAFYNQLTKDVMGMFAPQSSIRAYQEKDEKEKKEKEAAEQKPQLKSGNNQQKQEAPPAQEQKVKRRSIEQVFYLDAQKDRFFWSFITSGGIHELESDGTFKPVSTMKRVAYLLEKDPQRPTVYRLMYRFNTDTAELAPIRAADFYPSYELISGITHLEMELTVFEVEKEEQKEGEGAAKKMQKNEEAKPSKEKREKKRQSASLKEWNEAIVWQTYRTLIPAYLRLSGAVADRTGREYPFEFMIPVVSYRPIMQKEKNVFEAIEDIAKSIFGKSAQQNGAGRGAR